MIATQEFVVPRSIPMMSCGAPLEAKFLFVAILTTLFIDKPVRELPCIGLMPKLLFVGTEFKFFIESIPENKKTQ